MPDNEHAAEKRFAKNLFSGSDTGDDDHDNAGTERAADKAFARDLFARD